MNGQQDWPKVTADDCPNPWWAKGKNLRTFSSLSLLPMWKNGLGQAHCIFSFSLPVKVHNNQRQSTLKLRKRPCLILGCCLLMHTKTNSCAQWNYTRIEPSASQGQSCQPVPSNHETRFPGHQKWDRSPPKLSKCTLVLFQQQKTKKVAKNKGEKERSDVTKCSQWTFASKRRKTKRARGHQSACD